MSAFWDIQDNGSTWEVRDGWLVFEAGFNQNLWANDDTTRFTQDTNQDFDIETSNAAAERVPTLRLRRQFHVRADRLLRELGERD